MYNQEGLKFWIQSMSYNLPYPNKLRECQILFYKAIINSKIIKFPLNRQVNQVKNNLIYRASTIYLQSQIIKFKDKIILCLKDQSKFPKSHPNPKSPYQLINNSHPKIINLKPSLSCSKKANQILMIMVNHPKIFLKLHNTSKNSYKNYKKYKK